MHASEVYGNQAARGTLARRELGGLFQQRWSREEKIGER